MRQSLQNTICHSTPAAVSGFSESFSIYSKFAFGQVLRAFGGLLQRSLLSLVTYLSNSSYLAASNSNLCSLCPQDLYYVCELNFLVLLFENCPQTESQCKFHSLSLVLLSRLTIQGFSLFNVSNILFHFVVVCCEMV